MSCSTVSLSRSMDINGHHYGDYLDHKSISTAFLNHVNQLKVIMVIIKIH